MALRAGASSFGAQADSSAATTTRARVRTGRVLNSIESTSSGIPVPGSMRDGYFTCFEAGCLPVANTYARAMRYAYHPDYFVPLPPRHPFPDGEVPADVPSACSARACCRRRTSSARRSAGSTTSRWCTRPSTCSSSRRGRWSAAEVRRIGVPWSAALWRRSRLAAQGTLEAARAALEDGLAANLAGGTHHAFADHGEGFCVLNDVAVAIRVLQRDGRAATGAGRSTSTSTRATARPPSSRTTRTSSRSRCTASATTRRARCAPRLDVGLADGVGDDEYLGLLARHLVGDPRQFHARHRLLSGGRRSRRTAIATGASHCRTRASAGAIAMCSRHAWIARPAGRHHAGRRLRGDARAHRGTALDRFP